IDSCPGMFGQSIVVAVGDHRTILINFNSQGFLPIDTATLDRGLTDDPNFTAVKIVNCRSVYIATSNGEVLFCPNIFNAINNVNNGAMDGGCFRAIRGGPRCPAPTTPLLSLEVTSRGWLLIGGANGLFQKSDFPSDTSTRCATFTNVAFSDGTVPQGNINAIKQIDSGQIVAVGDGGQVFFSAGNSAPPLLPPFRSVNFSPPLTADILSVDGVDPSHVLIGLADSTVAFVDLTNPNAPVDTVISTLGKNKGVHLFECAPGRICGDVVCGHFKIICPPNITPSFTPTPSPFPTITRTSTSTPSPTFTPSPGGTVVSTPTPGSRTPTPSPTFTPTITPTPSSGGTVGTTPPPGSKTPTPI
ncbi:MAG TPA: hypothetical protein VIJ93_09035, partial [bacterium]